nr:MAG TPA: hypothetical protein [Caudoviricetes sp.]
MPHPPTACGSNAKIPPVSGKSRSSYNSLCPCARALLNGERWTQWQISASPAK